MVKQAEKGLVVQIQAGDGSMGRRRSFWVSTYRNVDKGVLALTNLKPGVAVLADRGSGFWLEPGARWMLGCLGG